MASPAGGRRRTSFGRGDDRDLRASSDTGRRDPEWQIVRLAHTLETRRGAPSGEASPVSAQVGQCHLGPFSAAESEAIAGASAFAFDEDDGANLQAENQSELPPTPVRDLESRQDSTGTIRTPTQRVAEITAGNRGNNHIRVAKFIDLFPRDVVGGSNKNTRAPKLLTLEAEGLPSVQTDIAGDKKIFRDRGWIRRVLPEE